jgi:hypothetical protein
MVVVLCGMDPDTSRALPRYNSLADSVILLSQKSVSSQAKAMESEIVEEKSEHITMMTIVNHGVFTCLLIEYFCIEQIQYIKLDITLVKELSWICVTN